MAEVRLSETLRDSELHINSLFSRFPNGTTKNTRKVYVPSFMLLIKFYLNVFRSMMGPGQRTTRMFKAKAMSQLSMTPTSTKAGREGRILYCHRQGCSSSPTQVPTHSSANNHNTCDQKSSRRCDSPFSIPFRRYNHCLLPPYPLGSSR